MIQIIQGVLKGIKNFSINDSEWTLITIPDELTFDQMMITSLDRSDIFISYDSSDSFPLSINDGSLPLKFDWDRASTGYPRELFYFKSSNSTATLCILFWGKR